MAFFAEHCSKKEKNTIGTTPWAKSISKTYSKNFFHEKDIFYFMNKEKIRGVGIFEIAHFSFDTVVLHGESPKPRLCGKFPPFKAS